MTSLTQDSVRNKVRQQYAEIALSPGGGCCAPAGNCCSTPDVDADETSLGLGYSVDELGSAPDGANLGLGCGNPQAIAALKPGESVLDLGSGAGFDCFLAARAVGETGKVVGVDMTAEMINKARENAAKIDMKNVEFRLGEIEHLPLADASVDVIISNCVINLSPDKAAVFDDAFRVLKPGGRLAISDMVAMGEIPAPIRADADQIAGCLNGAASIGEISALLDSSGYADIHIRPKDEGADLADQWQPGNPLAGVVVSATIEARKPLP